MRHVLQRAAYALGIAAVCWFAVSFIFTPIGTVIEAAFFKDGRPTAEIAATLYGSRRVQEAIGSTLLVTLLSVVTVNIVGIFQVVALEYLQLRGRGLLKVAYAMPLIFTSVIAAVGYEFVYGRTGIVTQALQAVFVDLPDKWFSGLLAVLFAHTFLLTSFHYLFLRAAFRRVDYSLVLAARGLGASNWRAFTRVVLPLLLPTLFATSLLVIYKSLGSFAIPVYLGGPGFDMIAELILTLNGIRRSDMAALLSIGLAVAVALCILAMQKVEKGGRYVNVAKVPMPIRRIRLHNPLVNCSVHALAFAVAFIQLLPVCMVLLFSFAPSKFIVTGVVPTELTLHNYITVLEGGQALMPLLNSLGMSLLAVGIGLAISLFVVSLAHRYRNLPATVLDLTYMLPWALPAPLLAVGLVIAFSSPSALTFGYSLLGTFLTLPVGYALLVIPLMIRFLRAAYWSLDPALNSAARSLGASALYSFARVTLPAVLPVIILIGALSINSLLSEYTMSAFMFNVNNKPLSIALFEGSRQGNPEQEGINLVYISLIMVMSLFIISAADRYGLGDTERGAGMHARLGATGHA